MSKLKNFLFRNTVMRNNSLSKLYVNFRACDVTEHIRICDERRKYDLFDFYKLSENIDYSRDFIISDTNHYGMGKLLSDYTGTRINPFTLIEHGYIYFGYVPKYYFDIPYIKKIVTFGDQRELILKESGYKNIIKIGPYIHYANSLLDKKSILSMKKKMGKTLLVFPSHSINNLIVNFEIEEFTNYIEELSKRRKFDTVIICLYWKDIQIGRGKLYEKRGFKVVTAGHINDSYFLHRLKTILLLSDVTLSNDIGTHSGYCIYLGKPHQIFSQANDHEEDSLKNAHLEINEVTNIGRLIYDNTKKEMSDLFCEYRESISNEQYDYMSNLFGFEYIYSSDILKEMLS